MSETVAVDLVLLGRTAYTDALALQRRLQVERRRDERPDLLLLTEHEPVLTLGRGAGTESLRVSQSLLAARGIPLVQTERGGDITYHGPGQLVAYPILDLRRYGRDVRRYIQQLEESALVLLRGYGIEGRRAPGTPGIWVGAHKIASVGVYVSGWVSMHGVAINIAPDLAPFDLIHPCGISGLQMTSVLQLLGAAPALQQAYDGYASAFAAVFGVALSVVAPPAAAARVQSASSPRLPGRA